jgi:hypothetical protein
MVSMETEVQKLEEKLKEENLTFLEKAKIKDRIMDIRKSNGEIPTCEDTDECLMCGS